MEDKIKEAFKKIQEKRKEYEDLLYEYGVKKLNNLEELIQILQQKLLFYTETLRIVQSADLPVCETFILHSKEPLFTFLIYKKEITENVYKRSMYKHIHIFDSHLAFSVERRIEYLGLLNIESVENKKSAKILTLQDFFKGEFESLFDMIFKNI